MPAVPSTLLRPALEAAVRVARDGESSDPILPAPASLRRYLRFAKLPTPALDIARRVLDDDDDFRHRVAEHTTQDELGEAAWLWLSRPDGWEQRLDAIRRDTHAREHHEREERVERDAQRRLAGAESAARRAEARAQALGREVADLRAALTAERARAAALDAELTRSREEGNRLTEERLQAVRTLKDTEAELANRSGDLRHARHQLRMLQSELALAVDAQAPAVPVSAVPAVPAVPGVAARTAEAGIDVARLSAAIADASAAAARLGDALAAAAGSLDAVPSGTPTDESAPAEPQRVVRRPVAMPPGVFDDSAEAAEHLVRVAGVLLAVDGYNISHAAWPTLPITEQRARLIDALAELHARTGIDVLVVFDGAEADHQIASGRPGVRVRFSPAGVEADDVILDLVAATPPERPVIVASSDHRVRDGARRHGANVLLARQFVAALRR